MSEPVYLIRKWVDQEAHEFWFSFEDRVYVQRSPDGYEWEEPELTPYPFVPFIQMSNLEPM